MGDIAVSSAAIGNMRANLALVRAEFEAANANSEAAAIAVGHPALGDRVRAFANNWDHRRAELVEQLVWIDEGLASIEDGFGDADSGLAARLTGTGAAHGPVARLAGV